MSQTNVSTSGGVGLGGLLAVVFITLKLVGIIDWSWIWVLSPIWIPMGIAFGFVGGVIIVGLLVALCRPVKKKRCR